MDADKKRFLPSLARLILYHSEFGLFLIVDRQAYILWFSNYHAGFETGAKNDDNNK